MQYRHHAFCRLKYLLSPQVNFKPAHGHKHWYRAAARKVYHEGITPRRTLNLLRRNCTQSHVESTKKELRPAARLFTRTYVHTGQATCV